LKPLYIFPIKTLIIENQNNKQYHRILDKK